MELLKAAVLTVTLLAAAGLIPCAMAGQDATGERGRLEGVDDTVLLKFRHVHELPARGGDDVDKFHQEIIKRISGQWIVESREWRVNREC